MLRALWISVILCAVLAVYIGSPLVVLYRIGSAVEARDAAALEQRIDFPSVRRSFNRQIIAHYREVTGKPVPLGAMARKFALSVADPIVARLMTINALMDLLGKGEAGTSARVPANQAPFTERSLSNVWQLWLSSEYLGRTFYIYLPPDRPRVSQFGVEFYLSNWQWRIVGIDLPEELKEELTRELVQLMKDKG